MTLKYIHVINFDNSFYYIAMAFCWCDTIFKAKVAKRYLEQRMSFYDKPQGFYNSEELVYVNIINNLMLINNLQT